MSIQEQREKFNRLYQELLEKGTDQDLLSDILRVERSLTIKSIMGKADTNADYQRTD